MTPALPSYSERVEFRLAEEDKKTLCKVAYSEGLTLSCLVRMVMVRFLEDRRRLQP